MDKYLAPAENDQGILRPETKLKRRQLVKLWLERVVIALIIILLGVFMIFLVAFVLWSINIDSKKEARCNTTDCNHTDSQMEAPCNTLDCVETAVMMVNKMNLTADPCQDFHEYACGGFIRDDILEGPSKPIISGDISIENLMVRNDILTEEMKPDEPAYLQKMKQFYKSCMDVDMIRKMGLQSFQQDKRFAEWPSYNQSWDSRTFNLKEVIASFAEVYVNALFFPTVRHFYGEKLLCLSAPELFLPKPFYSDEDYLNATILATYIQVGRLFHVDRRTAELDAVEVVKLEKALSEIISSDRNIKEDQINQDVKTSVIDIQYNAEIAYGLTLTQLSKRYPDLDIPRAMKAAYNTVNVTLSDSQGVLIFDPYYFSNLSQVLGRFSNRTIQNLFGFKHTIKRLTGPTRKGGGINFDWEQVYSSTISSRSKNCVDKTSIAFWKGISKQFVARKFPEQAKIYINEMINNLKAAFKEILDETTWMGKTTKETAYKKLEAMRRKIGYPDADFSDEDINQYYKNIKDRGFLTQEKTKWLLPPFVVNAYYGLGNNEIVFPAGYLQAPAFSLKFPNAINYGGIGMIIGHELTHGFDTGGSKYNEFGNYVNWWDENARKVFLERAKCLIDQYSGFHFPSINMSVNGSKTLDENIADNGGLKESFMAYKELVKRNGEQPKLSGLGLTQDQVFFLAYAQLWCDKPTNEHLTAIILIDKHTPKKYRIIGPLQNSEDFAKAYNCTSGSYMNPVKKCSVW